MKQQHKTQHNMQGSTKNSKPSVSRQTETETSFFYWAHLRSFHLSTETESSLQNAMFEIKDRMMDNVQNCDSYINIPS
jgi:hypothetical protein